jgi:hypothetical protein
MRSCACWAISAPWSQVRDRRSCAGHVPSAAVTVPARRSCTYRRSGSLAASFATFGRVARRSACHCAVVARYAGAPPRVAALRRNSREMVEGVRPSRRAMSRTPHRWACRMAISSRSRNDKERPDNGGGLTVGMPPPSRNQRVPTADDTPASTAASSLDTPLAIASQNCCPRIGELHSPAANSVRHGCQQFVENPFLVHRLSYHSEVRLAGN